MSSRYRKKAVEVEAVQWTGENRDEVTMLTGGRGKVGGDATFRLASGEADVGDWIVRCGNDFPYPVPQRIFEATYEPAGERERQRFTLYRRRGSQGWMVAGEDFTPSSSLETLEVVTAGQAERGDLEGHPAALIERLPFPAHVSHNYTPRETGRYGGGDHIVVEEAVSVGRLHRQSGDALCKPWDRFHHLVQAEADRAPNCKRCIEIAERLASTQPSLDVEGQAAAVYTAFYEGHGALTWHELPESNRERWRNAISAAKHDSQEAGDGN